jgi:hypothetical protein
MSSTPPLTPAVAHCRALTLSESVGLVLQEEEEGQGPDRLLLLVPVTFSHICRAVLYFLISEGLYVNICHRRKYKQLFVAVFILKEVSGRLFLDTM